MKHIWFPGMAAILGGLFFYAYTAKSNATLADTLDDRLTAAPGPQAIHAAIDNSRKVGAALSEEERKILSNQKRGEATVPLCDADQQILFAGLFTKRIRGCDPVMAVLARFDTKNPQHTIIRLMCPARMEPWNMDRVAIQAWRESKDCLGRSYDIDLYETYIGAAPRKTGELRCDPAKASVAVVSHLSSAQRAQTPLVVGTPRPEAKGHTAISNNALPLKLRVH